MSPDDLAEASLGQRVDLEERRVLKDAPVALKRFSLVLGAVGRDDRDLMGSFPRSDVEQGEEVQRQLVGPLEVIDQDNHRGPAGELDQGFPQSLDQPRPVGVAGSRGRVGVDFLSGETGQRRLAFGQNLASGAE